MTYRLEFKPAAARDLKKLPKKDREVVVKKLEGLREDPRPESSEKLTGVAGLYRIRVGDYRVLYTVQDEVLLVLVVRVRHRREVYRRLK